MLFTASLNFLVAFMASSISAQSGPMSLCADDACDYCPNSITFAGTEYPACVIYERDAALGGKVDDYPAFEGGPDKMVMFDIAEVDDPTCRVIIRTPAKTDDPNCGYPVYGGSGGVCTAVQTKETFMIQYCCGTDDCTNAGARRRSDGSLLLSSAVLRDPSGNVIVPLEVGNAGANLMDLFMQDHGINSSSAVKSHSSSGVPIYRIGYDEETGVQKRDCDTYTPDGDPYSKTGDASIVVSDYICGSNSMVTITNENSVSRSTTFGASVGDPFGIVSASTEFTTEESASQSFTYQFTPAEGQCGHVAWTPFFMCTSGTITGCDGGDQKGETCTAKRIDKGHLDGVFHFVQTD